MTSRLYVYVPAGVDAIVGRFDAIAGAIDRADIVRFLAPGSFGIFTATERPSVSDGALAVVEAVTIADVPLASSAAERAFALAFGQAALVHDALTAKTIVVTKGNFAKRSAESTSES